MCKLGIKQTPILGYSSSQTLKQLTLSVQPIRFQDRQTPYSTDVLLIIIDYYSIIDFTDHFVDQCLLLTAALLPIKNILPGKTCIRIQMPRDT